MPETTIVIDRDRRSGLYEVVRNHLALIEDFWIAMERTKDFATAERLGLEFAEDFRLLQDIGWSEHDVRESYQLTMPSSPLRQVLNRLHREAVGILVESGAEGQASRANAETDRRFQLGYEACMQVMAELDRLGTQSVELEGTE